MNDEAISLLRQIASFTMYGDECMECKQAADKPNPECADHTPYHATDADDAENALNILIYRARRIVKEIAA